MSSALPNFWMFYLRLKAYEFRTITELNKIGIRIVLMPALCLPLFNTQDTQRKVNDRTAKYIGEDKPLDSQPYIAMWKADKKWQTDWLAFQDEILADNWAIF